MTMSVEYCTTAVCAVEARERQGFHTPIYTVASNNGGTNTTRVMNFSCLSCCLHVHMWNVVGTVRHRWIPPRLEGEVDNKDVAVTMDIKGDVAAGTSDNSGDAAGSMRLGQ